ncbi:Tat pathway signal protein [Streptomyces sp. NPDC006173]|uniref:golvesin C-terminal-like domain-containing protein n=1 Tax=Streptomyces sp. NPDC006173 TaxID=3155349 RepID=UPI003411EF88
MRSATIVVCTALTGTFMQALPAMATPPTGLREDSAHTVAASGGVSHPDTKLGKGWKSDKDRAVIAAADVDGLQILVSDSSNAYEWKTAASLSEPGMPADSWIGNQCVIDHDHAAVVYAPRSFTNKPDLMQGGAFAAIVNVTTGRVTKLPFTASLAYFDPSCNPSTHTAAFTAFRGMNDPATTKTRILSVNTAGKVLSSSAVKGEVTSAVPIKGGQVAALGRRLIRLDSAGKMTSLLTAGGLPYDIHPTANGKIFFVERNGASKARARVWDGKATTETIASGKLGAFDLKRGGGSRVFLTGQITGTAHTEATGITRLKAATDADISSAGKLAVQPPLTPGMRAGISRIKNAGQDFHGAEPSAQDNVSQAPTSASVAEAPVTVHSTATATGAKITQHVVVEAGPQGQDHLSPALAASAPDAGKVTRLSATASDDIAHDPTDPDRWCSVSRNDVHAQALQPTPNQVEWAVDMAVRGDLRASYIRQGGYRSQAGLGTVDPQGLFTPPTLSGGGRIPANVMLGIMAQESNLWQAESGAIPGQMGSPLAAVDGYYGHQIDPGMPESYWSINWDKSDCGYGVGQVTDGMRVAGHEKPGETSLSPGLQKAVAIDYTTNIAASMKILADKWNEVHKDGQKITVNNDDSSRVENWFTAVWNYNLGFNPPSAAGENGGHWGLGWYNNPANPIYKKSWGHPFMDTDVDGTEANHDAAHPQDWPYEEKVMGWAAWSIDTGYSYGTDGRQDWKGESGFSSAGFRPAWWTSTGQRSQVSPPLSTFCNSDNNCDPSTPPNCGTEECYKQYWWNKDKVIWKTNCDNDCGHELIKYQTLIQEPGRGYRLKDGTPVCTGAPDGSQVIASVPSGTETYGDCGQATSAGTFQFTFNPGTTALPTYEAKSDLHQIGGGYGGHFWYAHTRNVDHLGGDDGLMTVKGDWKLGNAVKDGEAKVWAHIPDTGAQTTNAVYQIVTPFETVDKTIDQKANEGKWVSLGAYNFNDQAPEVKLSNTTTDGSGDDDIAWGAIAVQPGDFSGFPKINFKAENPAAPDIDNIAAQVPQDVDPPIEGAALSARQKASPDAAPVKPTQKCSQPNGAGVRVCTSPFTTAAGTSQKLARSASTLAAQAGPISWCNSISASASKATRTEGCIKGTYAVNLRDNDGVTVGGGTVHVTQQIKLDPRSQTFTVWSEFSLPDLQGEATSLTLTDYVNTCWATAECTKDNFGNWSGSTTFGKGDTHSVSRTETFSWNKVTGGQGNLGFTWDTAWTAPGATGSANNSWRDPAFGIRCDNQVAGNTGCVFPNTIPTLPLNKEKYPAAAAYYYAMQEKLASHPGSAKYMHPLHREANNTTATNNRNIICKLAVAEWNPNTKAIGSSCDEYPFAKSKESGGTRVASGKQCVQMYALDNGDGTYTVKLDENYKNPTWNEVCGRLAVTTSQNTAAGGDLGRFTQDVRLLDNDAYYVKTGYESCNVDTVCNF